MFERWFTPQESRIVIFILIGFLFGSIVLIAGRSFPKISEDIHIQTESEDEAAQDSFYEEVGREIIGNDAESAKDSDVNGHVDGKSKAVSAVAGESASNGDERSTSQVKDRNESSIDKGPAPASININTAPVDILINLPGIGPSKAKAIVEYRQKNGKFAQTADITKVKGIGQKTYEKLKVYVTCE